MNIGSRVVVIMPAYYAEAAIEKTI